MDLWTQLLNLLSQVITPVWNDLLQYLPLLFVGLTVVTIVGVVWMWGRNAELNRSRVPAPLAAGPAPAGVHLPGGSIWPFFIPIGGAFLLLSLALPVGGAPVNPLFLVIGIGFGVLAAVGWYRDANKEWKQVDAGGHAPAQLAAGSAAVASWEIQPPEGVHLPGPSPWPFFAPIALVFIFAGLVFGPILIVGGLIMGVIAAAGWYLDAGREYRQVDAGHLPEPKTRDPEKAFPKRLIPVYFGVGGFVIAIALLPWLLTFLPGTHPAGGSGPSGPPATSSPLVSASTAIKFDQDAVFVLAGKPITMKFENNDAGVPHDVAIYDTPARATSIFTGDVITGVASVTYNIPPLTAGTYYFQCNVHPNMHGQLIAK